MAQTKGAVLKFTHDAAFINRRAQVRRDAGENIGALRLFRRAISEAPDNIGYRVDLAEMLNSMGCIRASYDEIVRLINDGLLTREAILSGSTEASALFGQACNLSSLGYAASAQNFLRLAREYPHADEGDDDLNDLSTRLMAREILGDIKHTRTRLLERMTQYAESGEAGRAYAAARRYLRRHASSPVAHAAVAWAHTMLGDQPAAMEHLVQALAMTQQDPWVLSIAARILAGGDRGQARPALEGAYAVSDGLDCDAVLLKQAMALGMDSLVMDISGRMLESDDGEPRLSAFHAAALINTGAPARTALGVLRHSLEIYPGDVTVTHYARLIEQSAPDCAPMKYPDREMLELWAKTVSELRMRLMTREGCCDAAHDAQLIAHLELGLYLPDSDVNTASAALLAHIGGDAAREALWRFLASYERPDSKRREALTLMTAAGIPLPRLIFMRGKLRRLGEATLCRIMAHDEMRPDVRAAARRLHGHPTAIIALRTMLFFAGSMEGGLHLTTSALECAYRITHGEELSLRALARRRNLSCAELTGAVSALVHTVNHQED